MRPQMRFSSWNLTQHLCSCTYQTKVCQPQLIEYFLIKLRCNIDFKRSNPSLGKPKKADTMDLQRVGFGAEAIAKFVQERTDVQIRIFRPPNYTGTAAMFMIFVLVSQARFSRQPLPIDLNVAHLLSRWPRYCIFEEITWSFFTTRTHGRHWLCFSSSQWSLVRCGTTFEDHPLFTKLNKV